MEGISIIIPVYNVEDYIEECLESVLANEFQDFEIICVDDGSEDSSLTIVKKFAQKYDCIKVICQENRGLSATRNRGLEVATKKYVYFLDSDDKITKNALGELYQKLESEQLDVLYFSGQSFYDSTELESKFSKDYDEAYLRKGSYGLCQDGLTVLKSLREQKDYAVSACLQILRKQFLDDNNIRFVEGIVHEDNFFSFLVFVNAKRANCVNDVYFMRRIRENSIMTIPKTAKNLRGYYSGFTLMFEYLREHSVEQKHEQVINELIRASRMNMQKTYMVLDETEREIFFESLDQENRLFFKGILLFDTEREMRLRRRIRKIKQSLAYRVGKVATYPIRKVKSMIKKIGCKK